MPNEENILEATDPSALIDDDSNSPYSPNSFSGVSTNSSVINQRSKSTSKSFFDRKSGLVIKIVSSVSSIPVDA